MSKLAQPEVVPSTPPAGEDDGYMLLGLIVAIALMLLWLSVAATSEAFSIRRDREAETARRADQYVRAIRLYYRKLGHYPGSIDQLEKTNNIRFLRRRWIDPLTGTADWRVIEVGKNLTTPKGFLGEPLAGLASSGLGALAGSVSPGMPGAPTAAPAAGNTPGLAVGPAAPAAAPAAPASIAAPTNGIPSGTGTSPNPTSATGGGGSNPTGAVMGIGTNAQGNSILEVNGQTSYQTWEFLYDPRVEALRAKQQVNSGLQSVSAGALGAPSAAAPQDSNLPGAPNSPPGAGAPGQSPTFPATPGQQPTPPAAPGGSGPPAPAGTPATPQGASPVPTPFVPPTPQQ